MNNCFLALTFYQYSSQAATIVACLLRKHDGAGKRILPGILDYGAGPCTNVFCTGIK